MSLIKQLWLATLILVTVVFSASLIASIAYSKNTMQEQLLAKNNDNATTLALTLSQMDKDLVSIELLLAAQFDSGHYHLIRLTTPEGEVILEKQQNNTKVNVPEWFIRLIRLDIKPGYALVQDGWHQYGRLRVESDQRYAYENLWRGSLVMLLASVIIGLASAFLGSLILRRILSPLNDVVEQAKAISHRQFITIEEPRTDEFKQVVGAMNKLSNRIRSMLDEETQRLEKLRLDANYDPVSGLMNRVYFFNRVSAYVENEDDFVAGALVVAHIPNLAEIDRVLGHTETNAMIHRMGQALEHMAEEDSSMMVARLAGADFTMFTARQSDIFGLATRIKSLLEIAAGQPQGQPGVQLSVVATGFSREDNIESHYSMICNVLNELSQESAGIVHVIGEHDVAQHQDADEIVWRDLLQSALDANRIRLAHYPVSNSTGQVIHQESPARMQLKENDFWQPAGEFISWANRLGLVTRIDTAVIECALAELENGSEDIGLNISVRAICDSGFVRQIAHLIARHPKSATHLWLEVPERGAFEHLDEFRYFCEMIKPLGCKIGIEHVGAYVARLGELHELGLDYIKVDVSVISGIHTNTGNQAFLRGLCLIAHSIGLMTIAEGVQSAQELAILPELGIDGMTGPAVR